MAAYKTGFVASPIRQLPVEILAKIFMQLIFGRDLTDQKIYYLHVRDPRRTLTYSIKYPTPLPFLISHVCSIWRAVALSSPVLWALLETPSDGRPSSSKGITKLLQLWISRSGNMPLSLHVCSTPDGGNGDYNFMKALNKDLHRVENMSLTYWCTSVPFTELYGDAPSLRTLKLEAEGVNSTDLKFPFSSCPMLQRLEWPTFKSLLTVGADIPWTQLTHLRLDDVSPPQAASSLASCPQLVDVYFRIGASSNLTGRHIKHENLRKLVLVIAAGYKINSFIEAIILPNLTTLQIQSEPRPLSYEEALHAQTLADMLARSECHLLYLEVEYLNYNTHELLSILETPSCVGLRTLKNIAPLDFANILLTDGLLTQLSFSDSSPSNEVLCPDLDTIFFMNYAPSSPGALGQMIASRFQFGPLRSFSFYPTRYRNDHYDWRILRSLADEGYNVMVTGGYRGRRTAQY